MIKRSDDDALLVIDRFFEALAQPTTEAALEKARAVLAPDVRTNDWLFADREISGPDALFDKVLEPAARAFPDGSYEVKRRFAGDGCVCLDAQFRGTFVHGYHGLRPHGHAVSWAFRDIYVVANGKITELWFGHDTLAAARALGSPDLSPTSSTNGT